MTTLDNPFSVETPELMSAEDINSLFVPTEEYFQLEVSGHVFLHGHRGSGKSMMFRRLAPDCQCLIEKKDSISDLTFFGVYSSIKNSDLDIIDFSILDAQSAKFIISEHILVCFVAAKTLSSIRNHFDFGNKEIIAEFKQFVEEKLSLIFDELGHKDILKNILSSKNPDLSYINETLSIIDKLYKYHITYLKNLLTGFGESVNYQGPLFGFHDFLLPLLESIKNLSFMPNGPIFILIDDVDNLNIEQTKVLNTWVSYRTTDIVSFKLSTQMSYKTYLTTSGRRIETPHDYSEINFSNIYTGSKKDKYPEWVEKVTRKRLNAYYRKLSGKDVDIKPAEFFPYDEKQQEAIKEIADEYISGKKETRGYRASDDAYRYARPDYIASLGGSSKNTSTYKYAGFEQLVHLSSGIIRYFLEPASKMFSLQRRHSDSEYFSSISPTYQNKIIREEGDKLLFKRLDEMIDECEQENPVSDRLENINKLRNLINVIGSVFYDAIKSKKSERRFFSFAISDPEKITSNLRSVLNLGVQEGFLYQSYIGTKEGMGRTKLYVLTRRLAPCFNLDPVGFSAYKFLTCDFLEQACINPKTMTNKIKKSGIESFEHILEPRQESLL